MRSFCQVQIFRCSKRRIIRIIIPVRLCGNNTISCGIKVCGHVLCAIKVDALTCLRIRSIRCQENERIVAIFGGFNRYFCTVSNLIETCNVGDTVLAVCVNAGQLRIAIRISSAIDVILVHICGQHKSLAAVLHLLPVNKVIYFFVAIAVAPQLTKRKISICRRDNTI